MSSSDDEGRGSDADNGSEGGGATRERSATYAGSKCMELLGLLRSAKHAGRIKALRRFQDYVQRFRPEFYDDDVELLLVGSASLDGLVPWCGYKSSQGRGEEALKTTSRAVLQLLHWLVATYKEDASSSGGAGAGRGGSSSGSNVFLDKFVELPPSLLKRMELGLHVHAAAADGEGATEAFELLSLLLTRHKGVDGGGVKEEGGEGGGAGEALGLDVLLPEPEAQAQFTRWLQQSASEQQLIDRVEKQRAALASASASTAAGGGSKGLPPGLAGPGAGAGAGSGAGPCLDPLGLNNNLDLVSAEQARPKSTMPGAGGGAGGKGGALLGAKDRMFLLQRLQQAALGGGGSGGAQAAGQAAAAAGAGKGAAGGKYTRNKARALKSAAAAASGAGAGAGAGSAASIVPQDEAFDPVLFLTIIHGGSSFEDLRRGQENLERGLGTQAGQLQRLVLEHYDAFARCAEGIQWFRHMVEEEFFREANGSNGSGGGNGKGGGGDGEGAKIAHLLEIVAGTQAGAKELFRPLLERMDRAKGLRSARLLLQRLARVLDVPGRMAKLEAQGKYEEVVREYERVRALPSGAGLLGRVQHQAEAVADRLRARLRAFVGADAHPFEELVQAAELLVRLGPGKGPGTEGEPLLFTFARQAEVLGKGLDALEAWYGKGLQAVGEQEQREEVRRQLVMQQQQQQQQQAPVSSPAAMHQQQRAGAVGWKQRSFHSSGDGDATDEEEDEEEGGGEEGGLPGRSHSHGSHGDGEEEDGGDDDEDSLEDDSLAAASAAASALLGGTGPLFGDEDGGEEDPLLASPMPGGRRGPGGQRERGGGLDFSTGFGLESVEHRASALRLQYARRLVRLALRSLPTLLRLAALVAEELPDVRVTWEAGHHAFHVVSAGGGAGSGGGGGRDRAGSQLRLVTGGGGAGGGQEVTAASAALDKVTLALQRISKAARRAMFGEPGGPPPPRSPKQGAAQAHAHAQARAEAAAGPVRHRPLHPVYFREALRAVARLYEGVFALQQQDDALASGGNGSSSSTAAAGLADTTAGLAKAVLPSLRALVEDAQRKQAQSVLDRLGEEAARLGQREDWAKCAAAAADAFSVSAPPAGVAAGMAVGGSGWWPLLALAHEEDRGAVSPKALKGGSTLPVPGTGLPRAFLELALAALEDLAATLPRPFWCAEQAAAGLDRALSRLLAAMAALGAADDAREGGPAVAAVGPPRPLRLLALVGNCIQLHAAVLPLLAAAAHRLLEAEKPSLAGPGAKGRVLALHDDCLRLYLEGKAAALDAALADGWVVKAKSLRGALAAMPLPPSPPTGAGGGAGAGASSAAMIAPPAYLSRVLLLLVQAKAEAQELLGERALLTEDADDEEEEKEEEGEGEEGAGGRLSYVDAVMRKLAQATVQGLTARAAELTQALAGGMKQQSQQSGDRRRVVVAGLAHCAYVEAAFLLQGPLKAFVPGERVEAVRRGLEPLKALAIEGLVGGGEDEEGEEEGEEEGARVMEYTAEHVGRALRVYVASV